MLVSDFNYDLPEERIAKFPPRDRGSTRLLVLNKSTGEIQDSYYRNLVDFLNPGDLLILNDTRVMQSRLFCALPDGRPRELIVLEKHNSSTDNSNAERVMYRGKLHPGDILQISLQISGSKDVENISDHQIIVKNILGGGIAEVETNIPLTELAEKYGTVPLPPYLHRTASADDKARYQTVWAKNLGSAAAPTASLNMTEDLLKRLQDKGVIIKYLTLHVGLGTFLPIRTDKIEDHKMHSEWYHIPDDTLSAIKNIQEKQLANIKNPSEPSSINTDIPRIVALGTTVARTLEYYAITGESEGEDDIFIYPSFKFQLVDALITNFHAPSSTVLMLASAFAGWDYLKTAYTHAIEQKYNFLSYGDSMLIC